MGKSDGGLLIAGAIIIVGLMLGQQTQAPQIIETGGSSVDLCKLVSGEASFTGRRMMVEGTTLPDEDVRVIRKGSFMDLGQHLLDREYENNTIDTTPGAKYMLYWGEASTTYYTHVEEYTAPCQEGTDDLSADLCVIDTGPTITTFDENGQVQSTTANDQTIGANDIVDVQVKIKASADDCYGNPSAPAGKTNAICFDYNSTCYVSVKADTPPIATPYSVSSAITVGRVAECYEAPVLIGESGKDTAFFTVTIEAGSQNPGAPSGNITVKFEDIAFDLNQDTLEEIWGFEDEDRNNIGDSAVESGTIRVA
jgi:hypothetical protein